MHETPADAARKTRPSGRGYATRMSGVCIFLQKGNIACNVSFLWRNIEDLMSGRQLVIIHGWSDSSRSFLFLARYLEKALGRSAKLINVSDYVSMDDEVTFNDLVAALAQAWRNKKLPTEPRSVDVVVHSTGSLIIRQWLSAHYLPKNSPIYHLVMLAPANFGSPLAHKGKAFFGRIIKGFKSKKLFNVGVKLLNGLEMGSSYTWWLAHQDRFGERDYYGPGKIFCTVIGGNTGYEGIAAPANPPGSEVAVHKIFP